MNSVILCEGFDDAYILGYYLHKTSSDTQWKPDDSNDQFSESYDLPKVILRNQRKDIYVRNSDKVAIWCVGGKDSFSKPIEHIKEICKMHPDERFENIILLSDRDFAEISECLAKFEKIFQNHGWNIHLNNNQVTEFSYEIESDIYRINILPIIIPFEESGAIETVLMNAIKESGAEETYIVGEAINYIQNVLHSGNISHYLNSDRKILKAKYSSVISITNPDRSTSVFDSLLMACQWEIKEEINKHFKILNEVLN